MFAYIQNNKISFISAEKLDTDFLTDAEKYHIVEYDNAITDPIYNEKTQKIEQKKYEETRDEKFERVYQKLLKLPTINKNTDKAILEGVAFSNKQIGDFIVDYVFDGNPHEQMSIFAKTFAGNKDPQFLEWVNSKTNKTNDVLTFFNMAGL